MLVALSVLAPASALAGAGDHRAGLVIRYASGEVETRCVAFTEPSITGEQLLGRSGLSMTIDYNAGLGGAVCSINNVGCRYPTQGCFCRCTGVQCEYWAYYLWHDNEWRYSRQGASSISVTDGALHGWSWGPGDFARGTAPPTIAFDEVCGQVPKAGLEVGQSVSPMTGGIPGLGQYAAFGLMAGLLLATGAAGLVRRRGRASSQ